MKKRLRRGTCKWCGATVTLGKTTRLPFPAHRGSKACREARVRAELDASSLGAEELRERLETSARQADLSLRLR